ncbi:MAG: hypothetical protein VW405_02880 [Rhodospirillaceae bacterium]
MAAANTGPIQSEIIGAKEFRKLMDKAARLIPDVLKDSAKLAMTQHIEGAVKAHLRDQSKKPNWRSGSYGRAVTTRRSVGGTTGRGTVESGTWHPGARMMETGEPRFIKPKTSKYLAIPTSAMKTKAGVARAGARDVWESMGLVAIRGRGMGGRGKSPQRLLAVPKKDLKGGLKKDSVKFVLRKMVRTKRYPMWEPIFERNAHKVVDDVARDVQEALQKKASG